MEGTIFKILWFVFIVDICIDICTSYDNRVSTWYNPITLLGFVVLAVSILLFK